MGRGDDLMAWKEMKIVEQRVDFVRAAKRDEKSFAALHSKGTGTGT